MNLEKRKEELVKGVKAHQQAIQQLQQQIRQLATAIEQKKGAIVLIEEMEREE